MQKERMIEIQIKADEFRENCKVIKYSIADLFSECERRGYRVIRYPIGEQGILGFAQLREDDKVIFTNSSMRLAREIFSLAHEIGHLQLHMKSGQAMFVDSADNLSGRNQDEIEQEANYFAACLLMPEDEVQKYIQLVMQNKDMNQLTALDIAKMMTAFNVSFEMAINRLMNLQKISPSMRMRLDSEKNETKVTRLLGMLGSNSKLNVITKEKRIPADYLKWVVDNYNHDVIPQETLTRALQYFELNMDDIADEIWPKQKEEEDLDVLIRRVDD